MHILTYIKNTGQSFAKCCIMAVLITIPLVSLEALEPGTIAHFSIIVSQHRFGCTLFRWAMIIASYTAWTLLDRHRAKVQRWSAKEKTTQWKQRLRLLLWMAVFEVIVCDNIFSMLFHPGK